ncbi:MAG: tol-pal system YbgF family protein [Candidatus Krumholzibacteriia bacterium]
MIGCFEKPLYVSVAVALAVTGCARSHKGGRAVDGAIALYIEGDYVDAERVLSRLTSSLDNDEERRTAYLYLGRTYMAVSDYPRALEAFAAGKRLGGGLRFDEYLAAAAQHAGVSPRTVRAQSTVSRGDLASLIHSFFGEKLPPDPRSRERVQGQPPLAVPIRSALASGVMARLADGGFHSERVVTRAAFYFVLRRLALRVGVRRAVFEQLLYPQGVRSAVTTTGGPDPAAGDRPVAGNDVVRVLQAVASASDPSRN